MWAARGDVTTVDFLQRAAAEGRWTPHPERIKGMGTDQRQFLVTEMDAGVVKESALGKSWFGVGELLAARGFGRRAVPDPQGVFVSKADPRSERFFFAP